MQSGVHRDVHDVAGSALHSGRGVVAWIPSALLSAVLLVLTVGCGRNDSDPVVADLQRPAIPEESSPDATFQVESALGRYSVQGRVVGQSQLPINEQFDIEIFVTSEHELQSSLTVYFDSTMPEHGHGMLVDPPVHERDDGSFLIQDVLLHMGGRWEMYFDIAEAGVIERAQWEVRLQ